MDILADIILVTYNQEKFVAQAIESVLMQQTKFRIRLIIGEDSSTDNTLKICIGYEEKYPEKIHLISHDKNVGLVLNYQSLLNECTGKYIAILEGDDYWTDPWKLQKQVDILESNYDIGLVHTDFDKLLVNGKFVRSFNYHRKIKPPDGYVFNSLIRENFVSSVTACFRRELFEKWVDYNKFIEENLYTIDYSIWLELAYHCKFFYMDQSTSVHRVLESSLTHNTEFKKKEIYYNRGRIIKKYYVNKYLPAGLMQKDIDKIFDRSLLIWAFKLNDQAKALEYFQKVINHGKFGFLFHPLVKNPICFRLTGSILNLKISRNSVFKNQKFRSFLGLR